MGAGRAWARCWSRRWALGGRRSARASGCWPRAIAAFYPELVWFAAHFWSETLFLVLLWWAIERLIAADARGLRGRGRRGRPAVGAGHPDAGDDPLLHAPGRGSGSPGARRPRGRGTRAAFFVLCAVLTVAPWTYRNWVVFHAFVPVSTVGRPEPLPGERARSRARRSTTAGRGGARPHRAVPLREARWGSQAIRDRQPLWVFEKLRDQMPNFWEADSLALIHIKRGAYGAVAPAAAVAAAVVVLAPYLAVLAAFVVGRGVRAPRDRRAGLLLGFLVYYNALHVVTHGFARYRLPGHARRLPVRAPRGTSPGAPAPWPRAAPPGGPPPPPWPRLLLLCLIPSFRMNLGHPAFGFADQAEPAVQQEPSP